MDIELKKQYLAALRSNKYKQCFNTARKKGLNGEPDSFCAVGVLYDIIRPDLWVWLDHPSYGKDRYTYDIANEMMEPLKLLLSLNERFKIVDLNDLGHKTFSEIADYIEENL